MTLKAFTAFVSVSSLIDEMTFFLSVHFTSTMKIVSSGENSKISLLN